MGTCAHDQDLYIHEDEFLSMHADGLCPQCLRRAVHDGGWAECPCCHKRWRCWTAPYGEGWAVNILFDHSRTIAIPQRTA